MDSGGPRKGANLTLSRQKCDIQSSLTFPSKNKKFTWTVFVNGITLSCSLTTTKPICWPLEFPRACRKNQDRTQEKWPKEITIALAPSLLESKGGLLLVFPKLITKSKNYSKWSNPERNNKQVTDWVEGNEQCKMVFKMRVGNKA